MSRPTVERVAYGDVTVMTASTKRLRRDARTVDPDTGEIITHPYDNDAREVAPVFRTVSIG